jgi:hypothetical protein
VSDTRDTSKATPRPWKAELDECYSLILDAEGRQVTHSDYETGVCLEEESAILIVQAVNSYNSERDKNAMLALENLTPGGSEYVGDVARCVEFIKWRQSSQHERIVKLTKQLRATEERDKLARDLAEEVEMFWKKVDKTQIGEPGIMIPAPSRDKARQLLKLYSDN